jgi:hypothetical protein
MIDGFWVAFGAVLGYAAAGAVIFVGVSLVMLAAFLWASKR